MSKIRIPGQKSKNYIPKEDFLTAVHYAKRYPRWVEELRLPIDPRRAIRYDGIKVQTSISGDETFELAARRAALSQKVDEVNRIAESVGRDLAPWLIKGCCYDYTFDQLCGQGIPCGRTLYYELRRQFYKKLSERI